MDNLNNWKENLKSDSNQIQWRIISTKDEYLENHREWKMNLCINCGRQHFSKTREFWRTEANRRLRFSLSLIILADLLGNSGSLFTRA